MRNLIFNFYNKHVHNETYNLDNVYYNKKTIQITNNAYNYSPTTF